MATLWLTVNDTAEPTNAYAQEAVQMASYILFKLSGEKYSGIQKATEVYGQNNFAQMNLKPVVIYGEIRNLPFVEGLRELRLRSNPVVSVESVYTNDLLMPTTEYTLRNNAYLVRRNSVPWILDPVSSLQVNYTYGTTVPAAGKRAAIRLANELIYLHSGNKACTLPARISTTITRQGETIAMMDPMNFLDNGLTGIYEVDLFLKAVNPTKSLKRPKIFSVDKPRGERIN